MVRKVSERPAFTPPFGGSESTFISQLQGVTQQYGYAINQLLQAFEEGEFTPTMTFATPGDLSVVYGERKGAYWRVGTLMHFSLRIIATPTFSSASGELQIVGLPQLAAPNGLDDHVAPVAIDARQINYPAGHTQTVAKIRGGEDTIELQTQGDGKDSLVINAADITSGGLVEIHITGFYPVDEPHP